jgi:hypothetical protein
MLVLMGRSAPIDAAMIDAPDDLVFVAPNLPANFVCRVQLMHAGNVCGRQGYSHTVALLMAASQSVLTMSI